MFSVCISELVASARFFLLSQRRDLGDAGDISTNGIIVMKPYDVIHVVDLNPVIQ
jgi:hypothetical protein